MKLIYVKTGIQLWSKELIKRMLYGKLQKSVSESVNYQKIPEKNRK